MESSVGAKRRRRLSLLRRGLYSLSLIVVVVIAGTVGLHYIEGYSYLYAFYYTSMVATGQGPTTTPSTPLGLLFVSILAFVSIGTVVSALVFVFGPFVISLAKVSAEKVEEEAKKVERES